MMNAEIHNVNQRIASCINKSCGGQSKGRLILQIAPGNKTSDYVTTQTAPCTALQW